MKFDILRCTVSDKQGVETVILTIKPQAIDGQMQAFSIDYVVPGSPTEAQIAAYKGAGKTIDLVPAA